MFKQSKIIYSLSLFTAFTVIYRNNFINFHVTVISFVALEYKIKVVASI